MYLEHKITNNDNNKTVNQIIANEFKISTRLLTKLIKLQKIYLNGKAVDTRNLVHNNDVITIDFGYEEDNSNIVPTKMDLNIIYEDEWFIVIDNPARSCYSPFLLTL